MVLSEIEQQRPLREAREIMKLGEKWQQLMPGEKRPNFERAAREVLRQVVKNQEALDIHDGLMHEHQPREAHLLERYLKSGTVHPDVMHSLCTATSTPTRSRPRSRRSDMSDLPEFEVYVQHSHDLIYPGHYHVGRGEYQEGHTDPHETHANRLVEKQVPESAALPAAYQAVH